MSEVAVIGTGLWMPEYPGVAALAQRAPDPEAVKPAGLALDRVNRRRAGTLGRAIADSAAQALEQADVDPSTVASVVGSSIGEIATMIGILDQIWRREEPMSPAAFTVSVHNASSGLLSISCKNQGYATSMAADEDTPAMALYEGLGLALDRGGPVLVVCGDEPAPADLVGNTPHWDLLTAAVVLAPLDYERPHRACIELGSPEGPTLAPAPLSPRLARNPQTGLVDLVDAIERREAGVLALDRGLGRGYRLRLSFP